MTVPWDFLCRPLPEGMTGVRRKTLANPTVESTLGNPVERPSGMLSETLGVMPSGKPLGKLWGRPLDWPWENSGVRVTPSVSCGPY